MEAIPPRYIPPSHDENAAPNPSDPDSHMTSRFKSSSSTPPLIIPQLTDKTVSDHQSTQQSAYELQSPVRKSPQVKRNEATASPPAARVENTMSVTQDPGHDAAGQNSKPSTSTETHSLSQPSVPIHPNPNSPGRAARHRPSSLTANEHNSCHPSATAAATDIHVKYQERSQSAPGSAFQGRTGTVSPVKTPSVSFSEVDEQNNKSFQLSTLLKNATPQILEAFVDASVDILNKLRAPLLDKMANSPNAEQWIQQIEQLKKQAIKTRTVIGVVGNTGAGKSSVINAILDEERLVPTNCMRACTAVVTEISYNYQEHTYRAEIEFISPDDWERELNVLFQDILDGEGKISRECYKEDTDAGIAYAKIKAVYPHKTKDELAKSDIKTLLQEISHILGRSRDIKETDSMIFYHKLQNFVDSKEKMTGRKDKDGRREKNEREFWPLIRVVRLYVRSPALATGAVVVDLPGVHDANAARAAVAEGYIKQCTGLWYV